MQPCSCLASGWGRSNAVLLIAPDAAIQYVPRLPMIEPIVLRQSDANEHLHAVQSVSRYCGNSEADRCRTRPLYYGCKHRYNSLIIVIVSATLPLCPPNHVLHVLYAFRWSHPPPPPLPKYPRQAVGIEVDLAAIASAEGNAARNGFTMDTYHPQEVPLSSLCGRSSLRSVYEAANKSFFSYSSCTLLHDACAVINRSARYVSSRLVTICRCAPPAVMLKYRWALAKSLTSS